MVTPNVRTSHGRTEPSHLADSSLQVQTVLNDFVASAREAFAQDLLSIVMFGSGAEGRLRPTSDVNAILVVSKFDQARRDHLRRPLRFASAAVQLTADVPVAG